jgi:ankyrin repeat protein
LDNKGSSPLHWACFLGCENSVNFLTHWDVQINKSDDEGLTPLHLGVISGISRVVRKLLIKGADRYIKSKEGKTASALATENEFYNINDMLQL